jgi:hypothetical protein
LWISTTLSVATTWITKMFENFVKSCSPNIELPTFLVKNVVGLPMWIELWNKRHHLCVIRP